MATGWSACRLERRRRSGSMWRACGKQCRKKQEQSKEVFEQHFLAVYTPYLLEQLHSPDEEHVRFARWVQGNCPLVIPKSQRCYKLWILKQKAVNPTRS